MYKSHVHSMYFQKTRIKVIVRLGHNKKKVKTHQMEPNHTSFHFLYQHPVVESHHCSCDSEHSSQH